MISRLLAIIFAVVAAVLGAALGKAAANARRQAQAGEAVRLDIEAVSVRPKDVMPGLVAALRVRDRPWSFLHVPSWFAAFAVNFAFAALGRELGPLLGALRGDSPADEDDASTYPYPNVEATRAWSGSAPAPAPASEA